jgi:hypothetical protein
MDGICSMHGRDEKCTQFWFRNVKIRVYLKDLGINGRTILKLIQRKRMGGCELD